MIVGQNVKPIADCDIKKNIYVHNIDESYFIALCQFYETDDAFI